MLQIVAPLVDFVRRVVAIEPLPWDDPACSLPRRRGAGLRPLLAREPLPTAPERPHRRRRARVLRWLLAPEPLGRAAPRPRRRRSAWLRWLLWPEDIDST